MRIPFFIISALLFTSCFNGSNHSEKYNFEFYSSWHPPVFYSFDEDSVSLKIYSISNRYKIEERINNDLTDVTFIVHFYNSYNLQKSVSRSFFKKLNKFDYETSVTLGESRIDGSGFVLKKINDKDTLRIICQNPRRNDETFNKEFNLLDIFFDLVYNLSLSEKDDSITRELYSKYGRAIRFKELSRQPLEYSIWGKESFETRKDDSLRMLDFLNDIPSTQPVLIRVNHSRIDHFSNYIDRRNLYFYGDNQVDKCYKDYLKVSKMINDVGNDSMLYRYVSDTLGNNALSNYGYCKIMLEHKSDNFYVNRVQALKTIANSAYRK